MNSPAGASWNYNSKCIPGFRITSGCYLRCFKVKMSTTGVFSWEETDREGKGGKRTEGRTGRGKGLAASPAQQGQEDWPLSERCSFPEPWEGLTAASYWGSGPRLAATLEPHCICGDVGSTLGCSGHTGRAWAQRPTPCWGSWWWLGCASLVSRRGNKRKWLLTRPFQAHVLFLAQMICKQMWTWRISGGSYCCFVVTKPLGFQDGLTKGT